MRRVLLGLGLLLVLGGVLGGGWRVLRLEQRELQAGSRWRPLGELEPVEAGGERVRRRLATAELERGESMEMEVCSRDGLPPEAWRGAVAFEVLHVGDGRTVVRAPVDQALLAGARRGPGRACVTVAQGAELPAGGRFAVDATWPQDAPPPERVWQAEVRARVLAWTPLGPRDRWPVLLGLLGALLVLVGLLVRPRRDPFERAARADGDADAEPAPASDAEPGLPLLRLAAGLALLVGAAVALSFVPLAGAAYGLISGLVLASVQLLAAALLVRGTRLGSVARALALGRPRRWWLVLLAPLVGLAVRWAGVWLAGLVPSTGQAPVERLVSMPSGTLAFATVAVVVPLAEEIFFRGFVWGVAERWLGAVAAFGVTVLLFALAHVPQLWGAWGSLAAVTVTGLALTGLRWWSGSTVVPAVAHLAHNGVIVAVVLLG